jgi:hypothetical protein
MCSKDIYLPTYARATLNASPLSSAATILMVNVASVFGCVAMRRFTDRLHVSSCILLSTTGAVVGVFCFWGLSASLPVLYSFCILYGLFAGSFTSCWPGIMRDVAAKGGDNTVDPVMIFGWLAAGRGLGNVVSRPLSEALLGRGADWRAAFGYGSGYGGLIVFTGVTALAGGSPWLWKRLGLL